MVWLNTGIRINKYEDVLPMVFVKRFGSLAIGQKTRNQEQNTSMALKKATCKIAWLPSKAEHSCRPCGNPCLNRTQNGHVSSILISSWLWFVVSTFNFRQALVKIPGAFTVSIQHLRDRGFLHGIRSQRLAFCQERLPHGFWLHVADYEFDQTLRVLNSEGRAASCILTHFGLEQKLDA